MLDEDVQEKGYALLCVAQPQCDCEVQTIEEVCTSFAAFLPPSHLHTVGQ